MVKRVLGLPTETITLDFGSVLINGSDDLDVWGNGHTFPEGSWKVGEGELFVLSDNRSATLDDGRSFGAIPLAGVLKVWRTQHGHGI